MISFFLFIEGGHNCVHFSITIVYFDLSTKSNSTTSLEISWIALWLVWDDYQKKLKYLGLQLTLLWELLTPQTISIVWIGFGIVKIQWLTIVNMKIVNSSFYIETKMHEL